MKNYDLRSFDISTITEIIKGYFNCKITLTSQQHQELPPNFLQLCYHRGISIEINNCVSNFDFSSQVNEWNGIRRPRLVKGYKSLPNNVFFNDKKKATTLMFDDKATVVKCGDGDKYSRRVGFLEAYFQATCGLSKTQAKKYLDKIVEEKEDKKGNKKK